MTTSRASTAFVCGFEYYYDWCEGPLTIYPTIYVLKTERPWVEEEGIVQLEINFVQKIDRSFDEKNELYCQKWREIKKGDLEVTKANLLKQLAKIEKKLAIADKDDKPLLIEKILVEQETQSLLLITNSQKVLKISLYTYVRRYGHYIENNSWERFKECLIGDGQFSSYLYWADAPGRHFYLSEIDDVWENVTQCYSNHLMAVEEQQ